MPYKLGTYIILVDRFDRAAALALSRAGKLEFETGGRRHIGPYADDPGYGNRGKMDRPELALERDLVLLNSYANHLRSVTPRSAADMALAPEMTRMLTLGEQNTGLSARDFLDRRETRKLGKKGIIEKCKLIKAEHTVTYTFTGLRKIPEGYLIQGITETDSEPEVKFPTTFLIKYPAALSNNLVIVHQSGRTTLHDQVNSYGVYLALENDK